MEYFSKLYNINICIKKFKNTFDWMDMYLFFFFFFYKFCKCAFSNFQIEINHNICTKVTKTWSTFGINFSNHKFVSL